MFANMKPLPKALIIFVPIALAVFLGTKFLPEKQVPPVVTPVAVQVVPAETAVVPTPVAATSEPAQAPVVEDSSQSAGLKALLQKGKK